MFERQRSFNSHYNNFARRLSIVEIRIIIRSFFYIARGHAPVALSREESKKETSE